MIKIDLNDNQYDLPTNFSELKLSQYVKITEIDKDLSEGEKMCYTIHYATGIPNETVKTIDIDQIKYINSHIQFLFTQQDHKLIDQIKIKGEWYGLNKDLTKVNFGEYIDLELFSDVDNQKNLHLLMAILYRPIKKKHKLSKFNNFIDKYIYSRDIEYEIEKYNSDEIFERSELFNKHMPVDVVLGAMFFFSILKVILIENSKNFLTKKEKKNMMMKLMKQMNIKYEAIGQ